MNGDMIHDTFDELYGIEGMLAHLYLYAFLFTFIYVILNVNISIVTDAYEMAKKHPQRQIAKQLRQQRTPPQSPSCEPAVPTCALPEEVPCSPQRRSSRDLNGYMNPRYFGEMSIRFDEAVLFVCGEPIVGAQQLDRGAGTTTDAISMQTVDLGRSLQGGATEAFLLPASSVPLTTSAAGSSAMELLPRQDSTGEDFVRLLIEVQGKVDELRRLASLSSEVKSPVDELHQAVQRTVRAVRQDPGADFSHAIHPES